MSGKKKQITREPRSSKRAVSFIIITPDEKSNMKISDSIVPLLISNLFPAYNPTNLPSPSLPVSVLSSQFDINYARISSVESSWGKESTGLRLRGRIHCLRNTRRLTLRNSNWMIWLCGCERKVSAVRARIFVPLYASRKTPDCLPGWLAGAASRASSLQNQIDGASVNIELTSIIIVDVNEREESGRR